MRTLSGDRAPHLAQRGRTALNTHRTMISIGLEGVDNGVTSHQGAKWYNVAIDASSCGAGGKYLTRAPVVAVARVTGARVIRRECRTLLSTRPSLIPLVQTLTHPLISQQDLCRVHTAHFRAQPSGHHGGTPWGWLRYSHSISKPSLFVSQFHIFHSFSSWANFYFKECHIPQQSENCVCICIELFSKLAFTSPSSIWVVSS